MNLQLTLLLAYDMFPVILQNLRPSGFFSKETVCEKFHIAREKVVVTCHHRHIQSCAYEARSRYIAVPQSRNQVNEHTKLSLSVADAVTASRRSGLSTVSC